MQTRQQSPLPLAFFFVRIGTARIAAGSRPLQLLFACMDLADIRRLVIIAVFSDDVLFERLVLKGGNAISLVYGYGTRASLDVDFSIDGDFENLEEAARRIQSALSDRFRAAGLVLFDYDFKPRPATGGKEARWGGYRAQFKIIERSKYEALGADLEAVRRNAAVIGPLQKRTFVVDLSKWEFCEPKTFAQLQDYTIYVYTPAMLALEKIRAICQQMPEYQLRVEKIPRARDFYDIHVLMSEGKVDLTGPEALELTRNIFAAKHVPLELIGKLPEQREFHRPDWPSVQDTAGTDLQPFDFYFDFVLTATKNLKSLWEE